MLIAQKATKYYEEYIKNYKHVSVEMSSMTKD